MASLNQKPAQIHTHQGAVARHITPVQQLERSVMSCLLWEDTFYESGKAIGQRIKELCAIVHVDDILKIALKAKYEMHLRHVPLLLIREAFRRSASVMTLGTETLYSFDDRRLAGLALEHCITRPDDITEFLSIYWSENPNEPLASAAKRALGRAFHKFTEYSLGKYRMERRAIKLVDALRLVHPKKSELLGRLRRGELETPDTWEVQISKCTDAASKQATWTRLLDENKLGDLALLRNLRNLRESNVDSFKIKNAIAIMRPGKLLPINFITAAKHNPTLEADLEIKFLESFTGKVKPKGKTVVLIDISTSMGERLSAKSELTRLDVAASLAMIARERFEIEGFFAFNTHVIGLPARRGFALRDLLRAEGNTYLGNAIRVIHAQVPHDRLIVITDEQSADAVPDFKGYLINVAANKNGVGYGQCVHIDGWSDKVIDYIIAHEEAGSYEGE